MLTHLTAAAVLAVSRGYAMAPPDHPAVQTSVNFFDRLFSDPWRLGWSLLVGGLIGILVWRRIHPILGTVAGIGTAWLTWQIYNWIMGKSTPVFVGENKPADFFDQLSSNGWAWLAFAIGVVIAIYVVASGHRRQEKWYDHLGLWIGGLGIVMMSMLIYTLVFQQWGLQEWIATHTSGSA